MMLRQSATASAPASIGNVCVGFDILGQAFDAVRDLVTAAPDDMPGVRLMKVSGLVSSLPSEPKCNTALAAAQAVLDAAGAKCGARLWIKKGVPLSAGMGGSAASAVAGAAAVNALLGEPFSIEELLPFALEGERAASDPPPWDNVVVSLLGGLVLIAREEPLLVERLSTPDLVTAVLIHPDTMIETRMARSILAENVPLRTAVEHSRRVAAFVAGCASGDLGLIRAGFEDVLIEPQRQYLSPALPDVKAAALSEGALGCSFSGSGPSVFAWALEADADQVERAMIEAFAKGGVGARAYRAPIASAGVKILGADEELVAA